MENQVVNKKRNSKLINYMRFILLITIALTLPYKVYASCGGVYKVTKLEVLQESDIVFIAKDIPEETRRTFINSIAFEPESILLEVRKAIKGKIKLNEKIEITYLAINRYTSVPVGGVFVAPRRDGLVAAKYQYIDGTRQLTAIRLPKSGCSKLSFSPQNFQTLSSMRLLQMPQIYIEHVRHKFDPNAGIFLFGIFAAFLIFIRAIFKSKNVVKDIK